MERCYSNGIPDCVPDGAMRSMRVPSHKAIALAILRNDHNLYTLGFSERENKTVSDLIQMNKKEQGKNMDLFK